MATLEPVTRIEQFLSDIIDQGGGGGGSGGGCMLVVNVDEQTGVCDKTFSEIVNAFWVIFKAPYFDQMEQAQIIDAIYLSYVIPSTYTLKLFYPHNNQPMTAVAASANDYPVFQWG